MIVPDLLLGGSVLVSAVVALVSNASVLLCFAQSAELRSHAPGVFVLNLSCSNILLALVNMPATLLGVATRAQPLGDALCGAASLSETLCGSSAMLSMAALSADRWVAVALPLRYSSAVRRRDAALVVACSWLQALSFALTQLAMGWGGYSHTYASCTVRLDAERAPQRGAFAAFTALLHGSSFGLGLLVLCCAYLKVLRVARAHCRRMDVVTVQALLLLVDLHPR